MEEQLIGRYAEQETLKECLESGKAEFIAITGRRRVGKTYLVKKFFNENFDFYITGVFNGTKEEQLEVFNRAINAHSGIFFPRVSNWFDAFEQLRGYLSNLKKKRIVVFIDELPWLDTARSRFLQAFELFWNSWASSCSRLKLVVCGSATTWMVGRLFGHRGGLHNRTTRRIHLRPFTLAEVEAYLLMRGIEMSRYQIVETYMILGGIPYYLSLLRRGLSLPQNIDRLFFTQGGELQDEYHILMHSLFNESEVYQRIIEFMATKIKGFTRREIIEGIGNKDSGFLTEVLRNLEMCDFIRRYYPFEKKERDMVYQLTDLFTLFHLRYVKHAGNRDEHLWSNLSPSPAHNAWCGYAFEQVCLHHVPQIKETLGIAGVQSNVCSWVGDGAQIDLLIDRADQVVNVCEMKYARQEFEITKAYAEQLRQKMMVLRQTTRTRKALHLTMVTTYGVKRNIHSSEVQREVTMNDLFRNNSLTRNY